MILEELLGSEAIFGFCGWLTTQKKKTVMSAADDASDIATKIGKFVKANKLKQPRDHWERKLVHPIGEEMTLIRDLLKLQEWVMHVIGKFESPDGELCNLFQVGDYKYALSSVKQEHVNGKFPEVKTWEGKSLDHVKTEIEKLGYKQIR